MTRRLLANRPWQRGRENHPVVRGELIDHADAGSPYTSITFTDHLAETGIRPSIGSVADAYDNALMECVIDLFRTEGIRTSRAADRRSVRHGAWALGPKVQMTTALSAPPIHAERLVLVTWRCARPRASDPGVGSQRRLGSWRRRPELGSIEARSPRSNAWRRRCSRGGTGISPSREACTGRTSSC
jgi:transposase InsO family protein